VVTPWLLYLSYLSFDGWWFLRFLLPAWPPLMLGTGAMAAWLLARSGSRARIAVAGAVILLGALQLGFAADHRVFELWEYDARYPGAAAMVRRHTPEGSVIVSRQHSGSLRYYAARLTLRYDVLKEGWFDPAVEWLESRGSHPYLLLEDGELRDLRRRPRGSRDARALERPPLAVYESPEEIFSVYLFDLSAAPSSTAPTERVPPPAALPIPAPLPSAQPWFVPASVP
jgi:hypothetical protein